MDVEKDLYCNTENVDDNDDTDFNIEEYFAIDWKATGENLKGLLMKHVTKKMLEELFARSRKTINRYLENPHTIRIEEWIVIAKFLDMDIMSIIVTKGQQKKINVLENYFYEKEEVGQNQDPQKRRKGRPKKYDGPYKTSQDFRDKALYNEYMSRRNEECPVRSVEEFLNYLPLMEPLELSDFMWRIMGNLYDNKGREYLYNQMDRLIENIPASDAKAYADKLKYYCLTKPNAWHTSNCVVNDEREEAKIKEYIDYLKTEEAKKEASAYSAACKRFAKQCKGIAMTQYLFVVDILLPDNSPSVCYINGRNGIPVVGDDILVPLYGGLYIADVKAVYGPYEKVDSSIIEAEFLREKVYRKMVGLMSVSTKMRFGMCGYRGFHYGDVLEYADCSGQIVTGTSYDCDAEKLQICRKNGVYYPLLQLKERRKDD